MNTETFRSDQAAIKTGYTEDVRMSFFLRCASMTLTMTETVSSTTRKIPAASTQSPRERILSAKTVETTIDGMESTSMAEPP